MKKIFFLSLVFSIFQTSLFAQEKCGQSDLQHQYFQTNPQALQRYNQLELGVQQWIQNQGTSSNSLQASQANAVFTIPVVFHVMHTGQAVGVGANISAAQIQSAIDTMNARYRAVLGTNPIPGGPAGVDTKIQFALATRDASCVASSGIVRVDASSVPGYSADGIQSSGSIGALEDSVKELSIWPPQDYLNVWVVTEINGNNGGFGTLGYSRLPGAPLRLDGVVVQHTACGSIGTVNPAFDNGGTMVHEAGHYLGLHHTFEGDGTGSNCPPVANGCGSGQGDCCTDTPPHRRSSTCDSASNNVCVTPNAPKGSVARNYMNYSPDDCQNQFSQDQTNRMRGFLCTARSGLLNSGGASPIPISFVASASCTPQTTNLTQNFGTGIGRVVLANMDYASTSSFREGGYQDKTCNQRVELTAATSYTLTVEVSNTLNDEDVAAFIDYNNDGDFTDAGESIGSGLTDTLHAITFVTPASPTANQPMRMRIISDFFSQTISGSCYAPQDGQIEDFTVIFPSVAPPSLSLNINVTNNVSCNSGSDGAAIATVTGGTAPYTYNWVNPTGTVNDSALSVASAGTSSLGIIDATGDTISGSVTITQPAALSVSVTGTNPPSGMSNGAANCSVTGGTASYTFSWNTGAATQNLTGLTAGTYTVTVTDGNGCIQQSSTVLGSSTSTLVSASQTNVSCNGLADGSISTTPMAGSGTLTYSWSAGSSGSGIFNLATGTYTLTVTNSTIVDTMVFVITEPTAIAATSTKTNVSCFGGANGTASLSISGGATPYTVSWGNGATGTSISGLAQGIYTATITDAGSCTATSQVIIGQPAGLSLSISKTDVTCGGQSDGSTSASATGGTQPFSYAWSTGQLASALAGLSSGTYTLIVTDANGCTLQDSAVIATPSPIVIGLTSTAVTCNGATDGSVTTAAVGGTGTLTYSWNNGSMNTSLSSLGAGTYIITVTDSSGCSETDQAVLVDPPAGSVGIFLANTSDTILCNGDTAELSTLSVSVSNQQWFRNGISVTAPNVLSYRTTLPGFYHMAADAGQCALVSDSIEIVSRTATAAILNLDKSYCEGDAPSVLSFIPSGGTRTGSVLVGDTFKPNIAGQYSFSYQVTDSFGCDASATATTRVNGLPRIGPVTGLDVVQPNQSYIYSVPAISGTQYTWLTDSGQITANANNQVTIQWASNPLDTITVIAINAFGCTDTSRLTVYIGILGLRDQNGVAGVSIYPNPASNRVNLKWAGEELSKLTVYGINGELIDSKIISASSQIEYSVDHLTVGVYWLQLTSVTRLNSFNKLIIK